MNAVKHWAAATAIGLRSLPARRGTAMVIVSGVGVVVAVLMSTLAIAAGFTQAAAKTGRADRAIVLREGSSTEADSALSRDEVLAILNQAGDPVSSADALQFIPVVDAATQRNAFVTLRGVGLQNSTLRPEIRIVAGRPFKPGTHEAIVGRAAQKRLPELALDSALSLPNGDWKIVGVFESQGDSHESELLADADTLLAAYRNNRFNSVTVSLAAGVTAAQLAQALAGRTGLAARVMREDDYFSKAAEPVSRLLNFIAYGLGGVMAFGAAFGALNTMYSSVNARASEIATLRALGFDDTAVVASVLAEALLLALAGAAIGAAVVGLALQGSTISTFTGVTPSQLTFPLTITPSLLATAIACACGIGIVGGLFAAVRAARAPLSVATRAP